MTSQNTFKQGIICLAYTFEKFQKFLYFYGLNIVNPFNSRKEISILHCFRTTLKSNCGKMFGKLMAYIQMYYTKLNLFLINKFSLLSICPLSMYATNRYIWTYRHFTQPMIVFEPFFMKSIIYYIYVYTSSFYNIFFS